MRLAPSLESESKCSTQPVGLGDAIGDAHTDTISKRNTVVVHNRLFDRHPIALSDGDSFCNAICFADRQLVTVGLVISYANQDSITDIDADATAVLR